MATYTHLFLARTCEAPACRVRASLCSLWPTNRGHFLACTARHAQEAASQARPAKEKP